MSGSSAFWRVVADDGAPWGVLLPLMAIIGLVIAVGILDSRRGQVDGQPNAPWWTAPLLVGLGVIGLCLLLSGSLLGQIDETWAYLVGGGLSTILLLQALLRLSSRVATFDRLAAGFRTEQSPDAPVVSMILLPLQAGIIFLIVRYFPWGGDGTARSSGGLGILILWPFMLIPWLLKNGLGAGAICWIGKLMLPRLVELGRWLPGAITRRPFTAVLILVWLVGLWYWFMDQQSTVALGTP